jgi:predicted unusual protein kinase regulating ubiquinone biosynthesis (AarF/ABC1/UbiB family)
MPEDKKLPLGRLGRLSRMARVGMRSGATFLFSRDGSSAADQAAQILGSMRGLAAKIGQMASYVDGLVPEAHRDAYEKALSGLRAAAPTSSPVEIRERVERELGGKVGSLFSYWDEQPLASASIGQVHRARLLDGREVAVKVQHPGIERAIEVDLQNAGVIEALAGAIGPRNMNSKAVYDEIATRFREELDYTLEARRQTQFCELFRGDPFIRVPRVIAERSTRAVLTTELVSGMPLEDAAEQPEPMRRHYCETLWRFVYKGNLVGGMFNADPHPGNYMFGADGVIAFLDFGCVQPIEGERLILARALHRAARERDERTFEKGIAEMFETRGGTYETSIVAYVRQCFEPLFASPFHVTRPYVTKLVRDLADVKTHVLASDGSFSPLPHGMLFMSRQQFGFYSVLARLETTVNYADVERRFLSEVGMG